MAPPRRSRKVTGRTAGQIQVGVSQRIAWCMSISSVSSVVSPAFSAWVAIAANPVARSARCSGVSTRAMHMASAPCARMTAPMVVASLLNFCMSSPLVVMLMCVRAISVVTKRAALCFRGASVSNAEALCPPSVSAPGGCFLFIGDSGHVFKCR